MDSCLEKVSIGRYRAKRLLRTRIPLPCPRTVRNRIGTIAVGDQSSSGKPKGAPILCGLLPLAASKDQKQIRIPSLETWRPSQVFLTSPLLHSSVATETLNAFWEYLHESPQSPFYLTFGCIPAEGPLQHTITQFLQETELPFCIREVHRRALFRPDKTRMVTLPVGAKFDVIQ